MRVIRITGLMTIVLLETGCGSPGPVEVTGSFLEAVRQGDSKALDGCLSAASRKLMKPGKLEARTFDYRVLDETVRDDRAVVNVEFGEGTSTWMMPMVLVREEQGWKVDLQESLADMAALQGRLVGEAIGGFFRGVQESLPQVREGLEEIGKGVGRALEEMGKGLEKGIEAAGRGIQKMKETMEEE